MGVFLNRKTIINIYPYFKSEGLHYCPRRRKKAGKEDPGSPSFLGHVLEQRGVTEPHMERKRTQRGSREVGARETGKGKSRICVCALHLMLLVSSETADFSGTPTELDRPSGGPS